MNLYIIYDMYALRIEPLIKGIYTSLKKAQEAKAKLEEATRVINDFKRVERYRIQITKANQEY